MLNLLLEIFTPPCSMKYKVICYLSAIKPNLSDAHLTELIDFTIKANNKRGITGLFIVIEKHFFQIIEGETAQIDTLYDKIQKDVRHIGLIKLIDNPIKEKVFAAYSGGSFAVVKHNIDIIKLKIYLDSIKNGDIPEINQLLLLTENFLKYNKK